jgi:dihydroorotase
MFDIHWHARDGNQSHKETVTHSLHVAYATGLDAIAAMPNTNPPLIDLQSCRDYLSLADDVDVPVKFYVHIGLTPDVEQVKRAVEAWREEPKIIGMKAYWGRSTGDLSIVEREDQFYVLKTLAEEGYKGVLMSHCEKEAEMNDKAYDPQNPRTWSTHARPEKAEVQSFRDILQTAVGAKFKGTIHVAHVSTLEVVDEIYNYNKEMHPYDADANLGLSCGVTPHHLLLDYTRLDDPKTAPWFKCNPPLRSPETQNGLLKRVFDGRIPIIESDHAPHTEEDKLKEVPASGIISGHTWPRLSNYLMSQGMSEKRLKEVTFDNAVKLFDLDLISQNREPNIDLLIELVNEYPNFLFEK